MDDLDTGLPGDGSEKPRRAVEPEVNRGRAFPLPAESDDMDEENGYAEDAPTRQSPEAEEVERQLAHHAFVREERDREVRLLFQDVPAGEVAAAFRATGASLITVAAERAAPASAEPEDAGREVAGRSSRQKGRKGRRSGPKALGALSMRYFYALGETVYTVTITIPRSPGSSGPSEVVHSIAPIFPAAALSERELHDRMGVVFTQPGTDPPGVGVPSVDVPDVGVND